MADQPQMPAQFRLTPLRDHNITRIALIIALAVFTGVLIVMMGGPYALTSRRWMQSPIQMTLPADVIYRLSVGLSAAGYEAGDGILSADQLEQTAIALYEQAALGPQASAKASYRLGIIYAKSGYQTHAREMFGRAMQRDAENTKLYLLLAGLYADESVEEPSLLKRVNLLDEQEQWLATMTRADLYERVGQRDQADQLRGRWQRQQILFSAIVGGLIAFYALMGVIGAVVLAMLAISWLAGQQRRESSWQMPWNLVDVAEVLVVLLFLLVCMSVATAAFRGIIGPWLSSETSNAILMAVGYAVAGVCTIALIVYRIGYGRRAWRLLGLQRRQLVACVGQGILGFGVVMALLAIAVSLMGQMGVEQFVPLSLKAPLEVFVEARNPATFAIYFVLVGIVAPFIEEIIFRGFVYPGLRRIMTVPAAALASGLVFAAMHVSAPVGGLITIALIGVVLAYLYERSRSLIAPMITHAMYNSLVLLLLAAYALI